MTNKQLFIDFINREIFAREDIYAENEPENWGCIKSYWEGFCLPKQKAEGLTEKGATILDWMKNHVEECDNRFTCKVIAAGLQVPGRTISGSMQKLERDGYIEKIGSTPVAVYKINQ